MTVWIMAALFMFCMGILVPVMNILNENDYQKSEEARKREEKNKRTTISKEQWDAGKKGRIKTAVIVGIICCLIGAGFLWIENGGFSSSKSSGSSKPSGQTDSYGHDKYDAFVVAEEVVKNNLKSPSSAKFCSTSEATISCSGNTWRISGWVDAQNGFGATLRNNFNVTITFTSSNKYNIDNCSIK